MDDMKKTAQQRITEKREHVPESMQKLFNRCMSGKASPRQAIKMQCLECWGYVRSETAACDNVACPLFAYRPFRAMTGRSESQFLAKGAAISANPSHSTPQQEGG